MQGRLKHSLGWVEAGFYLGGVALLAVFFILRFEGERQREAGLAAFELASTVAAGDLLEAAAPNQELWAEQRIRDYEASLEVEAGPPLAVLTIGKLDIEVPVYDGADDFNLNRGVGRIRGTARVGADGNLGIAGHRDGFFRGLKDIAVGDRIDLHTLQGQVVYEVSSIEIVDPTDVGVLAATAESTVTLVTCYPFYYVGHAPKRFIVKAQVGHSIPSN